MTTTPTAASGFPPVGRLYDIDHGRRLYLHYAGSGTPTVVFEPGAGGFGLDYYSLFQATAARTTTVIYDRPGRGWSDPVEGTQTVREIATDLRSGLRVAGIAGPYVLVGHSLGGSFVRAFAQQFPSEVAGLVLIDFAFDGLTITNEDEQKVIEMIRQLRTEPNLWREWYPELFADFDRLPDGIREAVIERHTTRPGDEAGLVPWKLSH